MGSFFPQGFSSVVCLLVLVPHWVLRLQTAAETKRSQCSLPVTQRSWRKAVLLTQVCFAKWWRGLNSAQVEDLSRILDDAQTVGNMKRETCLICHHSSLNHEHVQGRPLFFSDKICPAVDTLVYATWMDEMTSGLSGCVYSFIIKAE